MSKRIFFLFFIAIAVIPSISTVAQQDTTLLKKKLEALIANHNAFLPTLII